MAKSKFQLFLDMEIEYNLFNYTSKSGYPIWDFLRVMVYNKILEYDNPNLKTFEESWYQKIINIIKNIRGSILFAGHKKYMFLYCPRFITSDGKLYDRVAEDYIKTLGIENIALVNSTINRGKKKYPDYTLFPFSLIARIRSKRDLIQQDCLKTIKDAVKKYFDLEIPDSFLDSIYQKYASQSYCFNLCLSYVKPDKIFVSLDQQKGLYFAARKYGLETFEIQHGTLACEYTSYSYPLTINHKSNIAFADNFLMSGEGWIEGNNIPAKKMFVIGNNSFTNSNISNIVSNGSILIISTYTQFQYLVPLAKDIATRYSYNVIYKLHPSEYPNIDFYRKEFGGFNNISIAPLYIPLPQLIEECQLMITISSTVYFEAKNIGKRVAVYKRANYHTIENYVNASKNSCFIDNADDIEDALKMPDDLPGDKYYTKFDENLFMNIIGNHI